MNDQSHKDEMAAALRADFARLRARGVDTVFVAPPAATSEQADAPAVEPPRAVPAGSARHSLLRLLRRS